MATRKPRRPNNNNYRQSQPQPSDYESDYQNYFSDTQQYQEQHETPMPPPVRSNEELNLSVLRRHNPAITSILSLAPYAVIYLFSPRTRQWEKSGVEGSLFVCQMSQGPLGEERYNVFVLNRRGLNNFDIPLTDGDNVEITEEYVILKVDNDSGSAVENSNNVNGKGAKNVDLRIYGLWIYSEPPPNSTAETRSINAQVIRECAVHAGQSLKLAHERLEATRQNGLHVAAAATASTVDPVDEVQGSIAMGRQVSLRDLFGQQRAQDDGWSTRAHHVGPQEWHQPAMGGPPVQPERQQDVLGDLFRRAGLAYQGGH
ncbi:decapping enzyme Dcp1 [Aspergillus alliaceus]|uniref:Decapping enzyme Dcp1 n=1 Tax=Petromyces alliaceus TaxID=209559 RepID=A0A5N6G342_PETAA|nr:decapping enzyme Dcp1 [Aspergillus alliaceus]KAB8236005.1 decapping enzyme Dcp1 [Aspergillus alliaceus]KAE8396287.1 decapping enzyme Dcp1 [Aspergillus alliaceus]